MSSKEEMYEIKDLSGIIWKEKVTHVIIPISPHGRDVGGTEDLYHIVENFSEKHILPGAGIERKPLQALQVVLLTEPPGYLLHLHAVW